MDLFQSRTQSHVTNAIRATATAHPHPQPSQQILINVINICEYFTFGSDPHNDRPSLPECTLWAMSITCKNIPYRLSYLLRNLYWRTRKQIAVFEVFVMLCKEGYLSAKALTRPVDYRHISTNVRNVGSMLDCFEKLADLDHPPFLHGERDLHEFVAPVQWLAVMICRSCRDTDKVYGILEFIAKSKLLGHLDTAKVVRVQDRHLEETSWVRVEYSKKKAGKSFVGRRKVSKPEPFFVMNERENVGCGSPALIFGLLLPSGAEEGRHVDVYQEFDKAMQRFLEVEEVFKEFFGVRDEVLAMRDDDTVTTEDNKSTSD